MTATFDELEQRVRDLEAGRSGPAQLIPNHEKRLDELESGAQTAQLQRDELCARVVKLETAKVEPKPEPELLPCCLEGAHSFSWWQGLEDCPFCGKARHAFGGLR